jgi:hypothetical protein
MNPCPEGGLLEGADELGRHPKLKGLMCGLSYYQLHFVLPVRRDTV